MGSCSARTWMGRDTDPFLGRRLHLRALVRLHPAPRSVNGSVTIRRLAHPIVIAGNTHLNPSADGYVPAISGNRALAIGLADVSLHPSSTVATLVVDSTGTPIWIVAFHGVCVASHGGS